MSYDMLLNQMLKIKAGDHMVFLYDEKVEINNIKVIIMYLISRIKKNERVFYISSDFDRLLFKNEIDKYVIISDAIKKGQLSILDKEQTYTKSGEFDHVSMINFIKELSLKAVKDGYEAFALTGELSWLLDHNDGFKRIMDYEYNLNNEIFGFYPVSAICRYNIDKFSSKMIKNIIEVHPIVIWNGEIYQNPFYFDIVNTKLVDIDKYYVNRMLDRIVDFNESRSRFTREINERDKKIQSFHLSMLKNMVVTIISLLEIHDEYTKNHSENVANISKMIATNMNLNQNEVNNIYYAGLVHDIGKIIIPQNLLNKKSDLTKEEYELVMKHSEYGYSILSKSEELQDIAILTLQHHERIDGTGYPNGLFGDEIKIGAKIIAVADSFDAMTSDRPYRKALNVSEAIKELQFNKGIQFDSEIVDIAVSKIFRYW